MSTRPPPPSRPPSSEPPSRSETLRVVLKVLLYAAGIFVLLVLVGVGLVAAACGGLFG
jgi:hypothetical protein